MKSLEDIRRELLDELQQTSDKYKAAPFRLGVSATCFARFGVVNYLDLQRLTGISRHLQRQNLSEQRHECGRVRVRLLNQVLLTARIVERSQNHVL
jgi:hypothetical protein